MSSTCTLGQLLVLLLRMAQHLRVLGNPWLLLQFGQTLSQLISRGACMTNCILVSRPSDPPCRYRHLLARLVDRHAQRCNNVHQAIARIDWEACKLGSLICSDRGLYCRGGIRSCAYMAMNDLF